MDQACGLYHMIGLLAFIIGVYYQIIAAHDLKPLYRWTVIMRYTASLFMIALWIFGMVEVSILLFAAIDTSGAAWTQFASKS